MTTLAAPTTAPADAPRSTTRAAFRALLWRDAFVLRKNLNEFIPRTVVQPFLLVFVFTYVFPKIGQGIGGGGGDGGVTYSTVLIAGVLGSVILFQGIQAVALPMVQEFGFTREIEDRVLAPLPVELVAIQKITSGALQCLLAALIVFPIAKFVPANPVDLQVHWLVLVTIVPLACVMSSAMGLTFGTAFEPRTVPLLFGIVVIPLTFLGCIYFPWQSLDAIPWLQYLVLVNPLVYISEGFRAALTSGVPTMSLWAVYPALVGFTVAFVALGLRGFRRRVLT
jgi:ABC-2 type transport system permease protein